MTGAEISDLLDVKFPNVKAWGSGGTFLLRNPAELQETQLSYARNFFTFNNALRTWPGHSALGSAISAESIMGLWVRFADDGGKTTYRFGFSKVEEWFPGGSTWRQVWEEYRDTTANDVSVAGAAVTSAALAKWNTRSTTMGTKIYPGDQFIMAADITGGPGDPWQTIQAVNTDLSITLTAPYTGATAGPGIARFRKKFHGTIDQYPSITELNGTLYVTYPNSQDYIKYFDTSLGIFRSLTDATTPNNVPAAKGIVAFADRLFAWGVVNGTYNKVSPPSVRDLIWSSDAAGLGDWTGAGSGFRTFTEMRGGIKLCRRLDTDFMVMSDFMIHRGQLSGKADPPVVFVPFVTSPEKGLLAEGSVVQVGDEQGSNRLLYVGQDDFYQITPYSSTPVGAHAVRDYFFRVLNRDQTARIRAEVFDEWTTAVWVYCEQENRPTHAISYDYKRDIFYGPHQLGAKAVMVPGHFVSGGGSGPVIDDLVGTIDEQTWFLGVPFGVAGQIRYAMYGGEDGNAYLVDDSDTFAGSSLRLPEAQSAAFHLRNPGSSAFLTRVNVVCKQPVADTPVVLSISDDNFKTILQFQEWTIPGALGGGLLKFQVDFKVVAERFQVSIKASSTPAVLEIYELYAENVGTDIND